MSKFNHQIGSYLKVGDANIYFETIGDEHKPALLYLHGGFGNIEEINAVISPLAEQYRLIGIDTRGHGKSTLGTEDLSYELLQTDAEAVLKHIGIDSLSIIGFSDGGIVGYRLAALTNLEIKQLVTIGSSWHEKSIDDMRGFMSDLTGEIWREKFPRHYIAYQNLNPEPDFDLLTNKIKQMWLDSKESGHLNARINLITCPTIVIRGENDPLTNNQDNAELSGILENVELIAIQNSGHEVFRDQPELLQTKLNCALLDV